MILINKVAVITGAKSGIGLATAKRFALEGARVILSDIRMANKETERIKHNGGEAFFFQVDVSKAQEVESLFEEAINKYGRLDILVNNAGIELAKNIPETSIEEWDHLMDVNLKSVFLCSKAAIPIMKRQRTGVIVNVASELGLVGGSEMAAYCASKGGVVQLTRAMAIDHASDHIRVNCVCPGPIETPLLEKIITAAKNPKKEKAHIIESIPLGRIGKPEEIAGVILFLASDESSFMTGAAVAVDGGWSAR
jgi:NAD(P)-dependent dehydrogenase (short-subunit alcohol dehydrogenase family)